MRRFIIFLLFCCTAVSVAYAKEVTLYVSVNGNDENSGTQDQPLATLQTALDQIPKLKQDREVSIIRIEVGDGIYYLKKPVMISPAMSGTEQMPIVVEAAKNAKPQFVAGVPLKMKEISGGRWQGDVGSWADSHPFDLYVNGKRAVRARTPNTDLLTFESVREEVLIKGNGRAPEKAAQYIKFPSEVTGQLTSLPMAELKNIRFDAYHKWDNTIRYLGGYSDSTREFFTTGEGMKPWNAMKKGTRFFLEGSEKFLDAPGEWFIDDNNKLSYIPRKGEEIGNVLVVLPVLTGLLQINGDPQNEALVRNIQIKGLTFSYSNYPLPADGFEPAQAASTVDAAVMIDGAENVTFTQCEVSHVGQYGIWFRRGCHNNRLEKCHIYDLGAGGIRIGETEIQEKPSLQTNNITVNNSIIQSGGYNFPCAVGVWIGQSGNNEIAHNDIGNFRYSGVSVGWVWGYDYSPAKNNKIVYNHIHHIGWALLSDMAGVYTLGSSEGTEVSHNLVHDVYAYSYGGWGLYTDEGSSNIKLENNLVYSTKTGGFHQHYGKENILENNIFAFASKYQLQCTRVEKHLSFTFKHNIVVFDHGVLLQGPWDKVQIEMDSNIYFACPPAKAIFLGKSLQEWQKNQQHDQHSLLADPKFRNPEQGDFRFRTKKVVHKINFDPFDYSEYGVYGDNLWTEMAKLPDDVLKEFAAEAEKNIDIDPSE